MSGAAPQSTDGVSASVTMRRNGSTGQSREREFQAPMLDREALLTTPGQRLRACDPGRRDMITAVTNDPHEKPISVSGLLPRPASLGEPYTCRTTR